MLTLPNLPLSVSYETYADLCCLLPEYPDDTDLIRAHRAAVAMAGVADLHPADAFQARLAAKVIAADLHTTACLALARQHKADLEKQNRSLAQALSLMRQMSSHYRTLRECQKQRRQPGASAGARILEEFLRDCAEPGDPAPEAERTAEPAVTRPEAQPDPVPSIPLPEPACAAPAAEVSGPTEPPATEPPPQAEPATATTPPAEAQAAPEPVAPDQPAPAAAEPLRLVASAAAPAPAVVAPAQPAERVQPDALEKAAHYAARASLFAAMIRADGGLSPRVRAKVPPSQLPADPAVIHALVHGDSLPLRVLDAMKPTLGRLLSQLPDAEPELLAA